MKRPSFGCEGKREVKPLEISSSKLLLVATVEKKALQYGCLSFFLFTANSTSTWAGGSEETVTGESLTCSFCSAAASIQRARPHSPLAVFCVKENTGRSSFVLSVSL